MACACLRQEPAEAVDDRVAMTPPNGGFFARVGLAPVAATAGAASIVRAPMSMYRRSEASAELIIPMDGVPSPRPIGGTSDAAAGQEIDDADVSRMPGSRGGRMFSWLRSSRKSVVTYCERCYSACGAACRAAMHRERARDESLSKR